MARNRVIYQSEALYVSKNIGSTDSGDHRQLRRVQSANYNFNIARTDVNQFGQLARIDALVLQSPTVALDFTYYPTDGFNERALGFYVQTGSQPEGNFSSGQMGNSSGQNFFIVTTAEGSDLNVDSTVSGKSIIGLGNGFLTNYSLDASVGNLPTVSVSIEALNVNSALYTSYKTGSNGVSGLTPLSGVGVPTPQINPTEGVALSSGVSGIYKLAALPAPSEVTGVSVISALRPGDIIIDFGDFGTDSAGAKPMSNISGDSSSIGADGLHLQRATLQLPLRRTPIERLGSRFAFTRVVDFPIVASLNVSAVVNEVLARNLAEMLDDSTERNVTLRIKNPKNTAEDAMRFTLKGARLTSESFSSSIGANKTVDLVFETQIGGPNDANHGIYLSGKGIDDKEVNGWGY
jgi:hypothetical protein